MATQKRGVSFNGTQIKFAKAAGTPATDITALSTANPAVAAATNSLANGDVVYVASEANPAINGLYVVSGASGTKFNVVGLDTTTVGTATDAKFVKVDTYGFCDATSLDIEPATVDYEDFTTNCDDYPYEEGTLKPGSIQVELNYDPDKDVDQYLEGLMFSQTDTVFQFKPKGKKALRSFVCSVSSWKFNGQSNGKYKGSLSLKIKSRPLDVEVS